MKRKKILFIILTGVVTLIFLITRVYNLEDRFLFDHDQEVAANSAYNAIVDRQFTLIGQETSVGGLFVGPFLWWYQTLILGIFNLNPVALVYAGVIASFSALLILYITVTNLSNRWQGLLAAFLYTISPILLPMDLSSHSLSYITLFSVTIYLLIIKIFIQNKLKLLPILTFIIALTFHIHLALLVLLPVVFILIITNFQSNKKIIYLKSFLTFVLPFFTFVLFEIRHNYLITKQLISFSAQQSSLSILKILETTLIGINYSISNILPSSKLNYLFYILLMVTFIYVQYKHNQRKLLNITLLFAILPITIFWFYSGHVPDYYFLPIIPIYIIITSFVFYFIYKKMPALMIIIILFIAIYNINVIKNSFDVHLSFKDKQNIIESVIRSSNKQDINVYYQMPPGIDKGYRYIFKWKNKEPVDGSNKLYILDYNTDNNFDPTNYYLTYASKDIFIENIGPVYIISVKL